MSIIPLKREQLALKIVQLPLAVNNPKWPRFPIRCMLILKLYILIQLAGITIVCLSYIVSFRVFRKVQRENV
jgi:hypothetical protein